MIYVCLLCAIDHARCEINADSFITGREKDQVDI